MSSEIKTVNNSSLETILEIKELWKFLDKMEFLLRQKEEFAQKNLQWEWEKTLENVFYSDVLMGTNIPHIRDKESIDYRADKPADEPYFEVQLEEIKLGEGSRFVRGKIKPKLEFRFNPENKNEMRIKALFYHDFSPFEIIEDALLLSYPDKSKERTIKVSELSSEKRYEFDIALKRGKDGYNKTRLLMAPVTRVGEVIEEAKEIYNRMGEDKIDELHDLKNSCNETVNDADFGEIIRINRKNKYQSALLEAMGKGTRYIFME